VEGLDHLEAFLQPGNPVPPVELLLFGHGMSPLSLLEFARLLVRVARLSRNRSPGAMFVAVGAP
ncbi:hypothetical protein, partial [Zoogloea sp.]|uniref:hypothetical protein n=1 Tax=Zoogloea sp. TaxID=49181 RepID=UPI0031FE2A3E